MQATDGVMTYHDLRIVWPYGSIRLDSLAFVHQTGTHATLRLTGIVPEEKEEEIINHAGSHDWIELYRQTGKEKKPIFMGRLQHVEIKVVRAIHYVTIQAVSHTYAMDLSPKTRTFQQVDRLYRDVVDEILSVYPGEMSSTRCLKTASRVNSSCSTKRRTGLLSDESLLTLARFWSLI